ncbi:Cardiolipin synthase A [compost metagenome]
MLLTVDREFADQVEAMLAHDFDRAREITAEDTRDTHRLQQLGMRIARLISPIL